MKKPISYILLPFLFFAASCDDFLELEPEQSLSTNVAFVDEQSSLGSLIGVYSLGQDLEVFGSMPQLIADYMPDNVEFVGSFPTLQDINNFTTLSDNVSIEVIWRDHYRLILAANAVIANVPMVDDPGFSEEERAQYVAEAKFLRAITYFQLTNLFAESYPQADGSNPAVPLVLEPFTGEVNFQGRATLDQVHAQIQQDLTDAAQDLPMQYSSPVLTTGRATQGAALGYLSRLHLYRQEWQLAADYAEQIIDMEQYFLANDYQFYDNNTPEMIFAIQNSEIDNGRTGSGGWASYYRPAEAGGRGDALVSQDLTDAYLEEPGDRRFTQLVEEFNENFYTLKFNDAVNNTDNAPLLRVTEMYLNRAEALAELNGVNQESVDLVNELRDRAGLSDWETGMFASENDFVMAILDERRKELAFEGHRRMDLLRKGLPLRTEGPAADDAGPGDPKTILPIPQREMDQNPELQQNTGYGS